LFLRNSFEGSSSHTSFCFSPINSFVSPFRHFYSSHFSHILESPEESGLFVCLFVFSSRQNSHTIVVHGDFLSCANWISRRFFFPLQTKSHQECFFTIKSLTEIFLCNQISWR
jgi:hypothetical protein